MLVGALAAVLVVRRYPAYGFEVGAVRGLGVGRRSAACCSPCWSMLAGGAVGPGRMADVGADLLPTLVAATVAMGVGGLVGGVGATWWSGA